MSDPATLPNKNRSDRHRLAARSGADADRAEAAVAAALTVEQAETEAFIQRMRAIVDNRCNGAEAGRTEHRRSDRPCDD